MSLKSRSSFSGSGVNTPNLAPTMQALSNVGAMLTDYEKTKILKEQQAIENERANELLNIQKAKEARLQSVFSDGQKKKKALTKAINVQKNMLNGQSGQQRFEAAMNSALSKFETEAQRNFNYDEKLKAVDTLPAEQQSLAIDKLRSEYESLGDKDLIAAKDKYFEKMGNMYAHISEASNFDGLKYNKADAGYKNRVYNELVANDWTPTEALVQTTAQASLYAAPSLTATQQKSKENALKRADEQLKIDLENAKIATEKMKTSSNSKKGNSKFVFPKYSIEDAIRLRGLDAGFFITNKQAVMDYGQKLRVDYNLPENIVADAILSVATGEKGALTAWDPSVDEKKLREQAIKLYKLRKDKKQDNGKYASIVHKYGNDYAAKAKEALAKHAKQLQYINAKYTQPDLNDTGLATLESMYKNYGLPVRDNLKQYEKPRQTTGGSVMKTKGKGKSKAKNSNKEDKQTTGINYTVSTDNSNTVIRDYPYSQFVNIDTKSTNLGKFNASDFRNYLLNLPVQ